ncbi:MAG TPA: PQQ-binding-like beta-propeller repeat protein [Desulfomonilia bacterium]
MRQQKRSALITASENEGWVLVYTLVFLILILSISASAYAVARFRLATGAGFEHILEGSGIEDSGCTINHYRLPAPEGWDHMVFKTDIIEKKYGSGKNEYYWQSEKANNSCHMKEDIKLTCSRPYILFLVQDSESLMQASGSDYDESTVYFKNKKGEISISDFIIKDGDYVNTGDGTYFKGSYGNSHFKAPASDLSGCSGSMPISTLYMQVMREIAGSVSISEAALASVTKGITVPFGEERDKLIKMLNKISFNDDKARLAKSLYGIVEKFPEECATTRHIVFLTDGLARDDGDIPLWLRDYDGDLNSGDTHISGAGSHCLDDVSCYSASKNIFVHILGPQTDFLEAVVLKGKGKYMPGVNDLITETPFTGTMPLERKDKTVFLENRFGRLNPSWVNRNGSKYYRISSTGELIQSQAFDYPGPAESVYNEGDNLYVSTSGNSISLIDLASGSLIWSVKGPGGRIRSTGGHVVAGPSSDGSLFCFRNTPELAWKSNADLFDVSENMVFLAKNNNVQALELSSGNKLFSVSLGEKITTINYDPNESLVYAGTSHGKIFILTPELITRYVIAAGVTDEILDVHSYTFRKSLFLCGCTKDTVFCTNMQKPLWSQKIENPEIIRMLIMDGRVYLVHFSEGSPCGGIDTGYSYLSIYEAGTGKFISKEIICSGRSFGPLIDTKNRKLVFSSYDMKIYEHDYSGLHGAKTCFLGTRLRGKEI